MTTLVFKNGGHKDQLVHRPRFGPAGTLRARDRDDPLVWIGFRLPPSVAERIALDGGEPAADLHLTVAVAGRRSELPEGAPALIKDHLAAVAANTPPVKGRISGTGKFLGSESSENKDVLYLSFDSAGLTDLRDTLVRRLRANGLYNDQMHGYTPHITLAYVPPRDKLSVSLAEPVEVVFDRLAYSTRDDAADFPLTGQFVGKAADQYDAIPLDGDSRDSSPDGLVRAPVYRLGVCKQEDERRYTFGVVYLASGEEGRRKLDAHSDFMTAEELEQAQWRYVRRGQRQIYLQHGLDAQIRDKVAGEWVSIVSWPYDQQTTLRLPDAETGVMRKFERKIPAGSVYMGVVWEPWAWEHVRAGRIRGFSFGGMATREFDG